MKPRGQMFVATVVTVGIALVTGYFTAARTTDGKIEDVRAKLEQSDKATIQRVATLEEAVKTIKEDNREIKSDVKAILRAVK